MKASPTSAVARRSSKKPKGCGLCLGAERAHGSLHGYLIGPRCLQLIENIASREGIVVPLAEFNPFRKPTKANG